MKLVSIKKIKPYEKNAKKHPATQIRQIVRSIEKFGFNQPIVVDKNFVIIVGHGRYFAAQEMNLKEIPVVQLKNLSDEDVKAYRLADNKLNESEWDNGLVIDELRELDLKNYDLSLTGFDRDLILGGDGSEDNIPKLPKKAKSKPGELYQLGDHRLLCGSATDTGAMDKLIGDKVLKLVFTSPPYNMNGKLYETYKDNLNREEYVRFNLDVIENVKRFLKGFLFWNISYNKKSRDEFLEIIFRITKETGLKFLEMIVWNKKHAMPITSKGLLTRQYEDILLVGDEQSVKEDLELFLVGSNDRGAYFNKKTQKGISNYWEIGTLNSQQENLKACFPVALPRKGILLMSNEGDNVLDPFGGSGSTLIACEQSKRKCFLTEIDPLYVDLIIERWENYTNKKAKKLS